MKIRGKKSRLNISVNYQPRHFAYASEPFVLRALYEENDKDVKLAKQYLDKIIIIKKENISELRKKCIIAWGQGEYKP